MVDTPKVESWGGALPIISKNPGTVYLNPMHPSLRKLVSSKEIKSQSGESHSISLCLVVYLSAKPN